VGIICKGLFEQIAMMSIRRLLLFIFSIYMLAACGAAAPSTQAPTETGPSITEEPASTEPPAATEPPAEEPPGTPGITVPTTPGSLSVEEQLARIDEILNQSARASIAYNAPAEMQLDETVTIELLLNPSLSEEELKEQITEPGDVQTSAEVEITPQMKAELIAGDPRALAITPLHDDPIQVISGTETTKWSWFVTAKKEGTQKLSLVIYRLVKYENKEDWRVVETYKGDIHIRVTLLNRLRALGWVWIVGPIVALLAIAAFRRWHDQRKPRSQSKIGGPVREIAGHIFISYRRSDSADIVGRIYDRLVQEFGRAAIFKDVDSIPLGIDFKGYLDRTLSECTVLLAIIGDRWIDATDADGKRRLEDPSDFVRIEIESALEQGIAVIPLLVRGAQMPDEEDLPAGLKKLVYRNGIPIRPDPDFHRDMDRLIAALEEYLR
jgi:hypothetical protein